MSCPCKGEQRKKYGSSHTACCTVEDAVQKAAKVAKSIFNPSGTYSKKVPVISMENRGIVTDERARKGAGNNKKFGGQVISGKKLRNLNGGSRRAL